MQSDKPIRILLVEDQNLFRVGIRTSLKHEEGISIVGEAKNGLDAVDQASSLAPDVVLMDIGMPVMDGIESTKIIKENNQRTKVIMLTSHDSEDVVHSALASGASGYCLKDIEPDLLCSAIRSVFDGSIWIDSSIAGKIASMFTDRGHSNATRLTECEERLLDSIVQNETYKDASQEVTRTQVVNILNKAARVARETNGNGNNLLRSMPSDPVSEKYENLGMLGQGGMSLVFKARHKAMNNTCAIKFLAKHLCSVESFKERFLQEARIMSQLSHRNIVRVYDFGITTDNEPFLVMEYADGPSLADVLKRIGKFNEADAIPIFQQIAGALNYAHSKGVVHRDIKPANVILAVEGGSQQSTVKLVDFGLAKVVHDTESSQQALTLAGQVLGSPIYMSPEQSQSLDIDERSDIYSFGCLMYESICGKPPFHGSTAMATMVMHIQEEPNEPPDELCSPKLKAILYKCLRKRPEERYESAEQILHELV